MKRARLEQSGVKSVHSCDAITDAAFCYLCMMTEVELTFISKGYAMLVKHFKSDCHKLKGAVESIELPLKTGDVGEMLAY